MICWTYGINAEDKRMDNGVKYYEPPVPLQTSWDEFAEFLADARLIEREVEDKTSCPWVSPIVLKPGATRRRVEDVERIGQWIAVDLDTGNLSLASIRHHMGNVAAIYYTTTQSKPDQQRWRIITRLDRDLACDEFERIWVWLNGLFDDKLDYCTRNLNRISFVPAMWAGSDNQFAIIAGTSLVVDTILANSPPIVKPPRMHDHNLLLSPAPDGSAIITKGMLARAMAAPEGRRLYRLMCEAAARYRHHGWELSAVELGAAGSDAARQFSPHKLRTDILREAQRALDWVEHHITPMTKMELIRSRLMWQQANQRR